MPEARFSSDCRASCSSPRRMSSSTLAQTPEKPMTVATEEAISNLADSRHGLAPSWRFPIRIRALRNLYGCAINIAAGLNKDNDALIG